MKISFKSTEVSFASVNFGETFATDGIVYMKTEPDMRMGIPSFGCSLEDGHLRCFEGADYVHPINMEVIEV